jgi:RNA polymerase sigma-70 factor (ECF subfamily)
MTWTPIRRLTAGLLCLSMTTLAGGGVFLTQSTAAPVPVASADPKPTLDRVKLTEVGGLLRQESVRKEVGLTEEQYKELAEFRDGKMAAIQKQIENDIQAQVRAQGNGIGGGVAISVDSTLHTKLTSEAEAEYVKKVCEVLKPAGVKRLKQAVLQSAGPRALLDRLAIRELQLTAEQEDKLDALLSPNTLVDMISNAQIAKQAETRDAEYAAALKVLTAEQRKRWDALVGKAFPTADLLRAHPMSEETMNEQMKWMGGVGGFAIPVPGGAIPLPVGPAVPLPAIAPPAEKKEEKKEEKK